MNDKLSWEQFYTIEKWIDGGMTPPATIRFTAGLMRDVALLCEYTRTVGDKK